MAQQTRTGRDIPDNYVDPIDNGSGPRTRTGSAAPLLGYDQGYRDGYRAAHGDGVGPVVSDFTPEPGLLDPDLYTARYTPLVFNVSDADGIKGLVVSVWFDGEAQPWQAYDLVDGFWGLFASARAGVEPSTATVTGDPTMPTEVAFSLLPTGGWRRTIKAVIVVAWDVGGTKTVAVVKDSVVVVTPPPHEVET